MSSTPITELEFARTLGTEKLPEGTKLERDYFACVRTDKSVTLTWYDHKNEANLQLVFTRELAMYERHILAEIDRLNSFADEYLRRVEAKEYIRHMINVQFLYDHE